MWTLLTFITSELNNLIKEDDFVKDVTKVLGITWNKVDDVLIFSFADLLKSAVSVPTKREVIRKREEISFVASIYDPLGLLNPVSVQFKILFQNICIANIG